MNSLRLPLAIAISSAVLFVVAISGCQPSTDREYLDLGRATFLEYCASCHGPEGEGDGPVATELDVPLEDLGLLSSHFDGVFPTQYVLSTIDGREEFLAHGTRDMPIWGNIWRPGQEDSQEDEISTQRTMNGLLTYIQSLQRKE